MIGRGHGVDSEERNAHRAARDWNRKNINGVIVLDRRRHLFEIRDALVGVEASCENL